MITSLVPAALFKLRNLLEAMGLEVSQSVMDLDLDELDGMEFGASVTMEVYNGDKRPVITDTFPVDELGDSEDDDEDEEPEDEEETEEEEPEEDPEDEDEEDEEEPEEEEEPEPAPKKKGKKKAAPAKKKGKIKKGSTVTFEDDGETIEGVVVKVSGDDVEVEVDDEIWELELSDLTLA